NKKTSTYKIHNYIHTDSADDTDESYAELKVRCLGLSDLDAVQKMAYYFLERSKLNKTCSFIAGQKAASLDPMDLITLTDGLTGWDVKKFRVMNIGINPDDTVSLECLEEHDAFYDDVYDSTVMDFYDTTLPDPLAEPVAVAAASLTEEVYYYRNRSFTRLLLDFTAPTPEVDPFWDYAEIYMKIGSGDYKYLTKSEGDYIIDPVDEGDTYYLKMKSVNIFGNKGADGNDVVVSKTIVGKTDVPTNLTSMTAAANGDSVSIFADPIADPDIEGYEVRMGDAWDGAIFISFNKNCSLRLNGVRPGTHKFWMSPRDNAGVYSATPVSAEVKVFIPPGYSELADYGAEAWDFSAGSHDNTEQDTYDTDDALKCSHTSDVLTGTWSSGTQDLNAIEDVRIWGDFRMFFESSDTTWNGVAPDPTTWNDLGATLSWTEIFNPSVAGKIEAILYYSTDNSNWDEISFFEVLCAEVTARYIKVDITITDPTLDSNLWLKELNMVAYEGPQ
ncbi:MAG: hypothetical protein DRH08_13235, partial [Deltaproteobacteria bacterium]